MILDEQGIEEKAYDIPEYIFAEGKGADGTDGKKLKGMLRRRIKTIRLSLAISAGG